MRETSLDDLRPSSIKYGCTLIDSRETPTHVLRGHDVIALEGNPKHLIYYTRLADTQELCRGQHTTANVRPK